MTAEGLLSIDVSNADAPPHPDAFAALGIRPLPARGERFLIAADFKDLVINYIEHRYGEGAGEAAE